MSWSPTAKSLSLSALVPAAFVLCVSVWLGSHRPIAQQTFLLVFAAMPAVIALGAVLGYVYFRTCTTPQPVSQDSSSSELMDAQDRERLIAEFAPQVVFMLDVDRRILAVNSSSLHNWGIPTSQLKGQAIDKWLDESSISDLRTTIDCARSSKEQKACDILVQTATAGVRHYAVEIEWSESNQKFFCVAEDVTADRQLARLKREHSMFIAHDLRSPLMSIDLSVQLFSKGKYVVLPDPALKKVESIRRSIQRLMRLTDDLIALEQYDEGQLKLNISTTSIDEIVHAAIKTVEDSASERQIKLQYENSPIVFPGDEDRLVRVMVNLLSNATKYANANSLVTIAAKADDASVLVSVEDQGPGIPPDLAETIFDRYRRLNEASLDNPQGSGLGLALCKAFVTAHNGQIGVSSTAAGGSKFWFSLPLSAAASEA